LFSDAAALPNISSPRPPSDLPTPQIKVTSRTRFLKSSHSVCAFARCFFRVQEGRAGISILRTGESTYFEKKKKERTPVCLSRQFVALYCRNIDLTLPHSVAGLLCTACYVSHCLQPPSERVYFARSFRHSKFNFRV
jgi:hypothetical protein